MTPARKLKNFKSENPKIFEICNKFFDSGLKWAEHCFLPIAAGIAVVTIGEMDFNRAQEILISGGIQKAVELVCLNSWQRTKGVYRFHPEIYDEIRKTELENLPREMFFRLPEWCIFIELQGEDKVQGIEGFWSWIEHDINTDKFELRLLFLFKSGETFGVPILLDEDTLEGSFIIMRNMILILLQYLLKRLKLIPKKPIL